MIGTTIKSAWPIASMTLRVYCVCGTAMHLTMNEPDAVELVMETFASAHVGDEHGPCDSKTAARARKKRSG
jgi:hypothetical protein